MADNAEISFRYLDACGDIGACDTGRASPPRRHRIRQYAEACYAGH
jgi:hypothetical protein